jgi:hypothetical protein
MARVRSIALPSVETYLSRDPIKGFDIMSMTFRFQSQQNTMAL